MTDVAPLSLWKPDHRPMSRITMADIARRVAEKHGLTVDEMIAPGRSRSICWPRQEAMYEMHAAAKWSLPRIAMFFGGIDHTTVLHGSRAHQRRSNAA